MFEYIRINIKAMIAIAHLNVPDQFEIIFKSALFVFIQHTKRFEFYPFSQDLLTDENWTPDVSNIYIYVEIEDKYESK